MSVHTLDHDAVHHLTSVADLRAALASLDAALALEPSVSGLLMRGVVRHRLGDWFGGLGDASDAALLTSRPGLGVDVVPTRRPKQLQP